MGNYLFFYFPPFYVGENIPANFHRIIRHFRAELTHMPENHRLFGEWTPERIKNWSKAVGPNAANFVQALMERKEHPEQAFRACMGIIRLTKSYPKERVENAAKRALIYGAISYKSVLPILQKNLDLEPLSEQTGVQPVYHENLCGTGYYTAEVD